MRKFFTLSAALVCCMAATAQQTAKPLNNKGKKTLPTNVVEEKTTAADSRPIAGVYGEWNGSAFEMNDSTVVKYTGNNGWDYATGDWKYDSSLRRMYDAGTMQWELDGKSYQQIVNNRITVSDFKTWTGSAWEDEERTTYTYAPNGYIATTLYERNNGSGLQPGFKSTTTYNSDNLVAETVSENWNFMTSQLENTSRTVNHYNSNKMVDTAWEYTWANIISQWELSDRTISSYTNGMLTSSLRQNLVMGNWEDSYKTTYTNDTKGNPLVIENESWNTMNSAWEKTYREEHTYNSSGDVTETKNSYWQNGAYLYSNKTTTTYNQFRRPLTEETQSWNATTSQWEYQTGNDNLMRYYYEPYTNDVKDVAKSNLAQMSIFPVPAKDAINISAALQQAQQVTITIMDMRGKVVKTISDNAPAQYRKQVNVADLPAGNYIINLSGTKEQGIKTISIAH